MPENTSGLDTRGADHTRENYAVDERRRPLSERVVGDWTAFEAVLFNAITRLGDRPKIPGTWFSHRLKVAQAMLDAYDRVMEEERTTRA